MFSLRTRHSFPGGIHPPQYKSLSASETIRSITLPDIMYLSLRQHSGQAAIPVVSIGDHVRTGQLLAKAAAPISAPVHAPTSGIIRDIDLHPVPHPSGLQATCIVLEPDGNDIPVSLTPQKISSSLNETSALIQRIHDAGIVGLGGAAFPAAVKMQTPDVQRVDTLLINGAECEPYISCDDLLMQTCPDSVWHGIHYLCRILKPRQCVVAIEDNKPAAIAAMRSSLQLFHPGFPCAIHLQVVPTRYPTGGEKQLIKIITGREVPSGGLPVHIGVVCHNIATVKAISDALREDKPLISRLITVTGDGIRRPGNYHVLLGTPISHILQECGGVTDNDVSLTMGGPMMGVTLHSREVPVVKGMNCLLVRRRDPETRPVRACIRCGQCARVCPMSLLPQQLYRYTRAREFDKSRDLALMDCIECGCCEYVCPSRIPLVQYYRHAKAEIRAKHQESLKSDIARERHLIRQKRIEAEQALKKQKQRRSANTENMIGNPEEKTVNI